MYRVLIIEDEQPASERLVKLLNQINPDFRVVQQLVSIQSAINWLRENPAPDLIFMDIHLADGHSFEIFKEVNVISPVIFVTAYDQYAIAAFKVNSIDYLLKPIKKEELESSLKKFQRIGALQLRKVESMLEQITSASSEKEYQKRMIIRFSDTIKMIEVADVSYFYTEDKINFLCTKDNLRYPVDENLDELELILNPKVFFRINRQFIINISAIEKMVAWTKSRVKIILKPASEHETIVSTERSPNFKLWLTGR
jgi:DNA-binding LytR/AlgR family response regulator